MERVRDPVRVGETAAPRRGAANGTEVETSGADASSEGAAVEKLLVATAGHLHARLRREQRLRDAAERRRAADRAYALGPEAGEWSQQATLAIRAHVPRDVLGDTIQPFPTFSELFRGAEVAAR
jgi:pyruvate/2-oxoglutarate dehydrogenase complex dihydrolipoamide dehydrogenase (E3) component